MWAELVFSPRHQVTEARWEPPLPQGHSPGLQTAESHAELKRTNDGIRAELAMLFADGE